MQHYPLNIPYGRRPRVLLLGNGINRAFSLSPSWDALLQSIQTRSLTQEETDALAQVPYPLRPVILTQDRLEEHLPAIAENLAALQAGAQEEALLRDFAALPVEAILTTNYTYELEKALIPDFRCAFGRRCKYRKIAFSSGGADSIHRLHTYFSPPGTAVSIWHIHGEAARPKTMVLGHYAYGKLLSRAQQQVAGVLARYKGRSAHPNDLQLHSWLEFFLLSDVYVVGFGLELSELDLWWLINCKKRHFPQTKTVLYKPDLPTAQRLLADAYGVEVVCVPRVGSDYPTYYRTVYRELQTQLAEVPSHPKKKDCL